MHLFKEYKLYIHTISIILLLINLSYPNDFNREIPGDINGDGFVDIIDVVILVNSILNNNVTSELDINNDGLINIVDVVELINIILDDNFLEPGENAFGSLNSFDIITWNIEHFPKNNTTIDTLAYIIPELFVDIVALQEIESTYSLNTLALDLGNNWISYIAEENSSWGELSFLINTTEVEVTQTPYVILSQYSYYFAYRPPFVLHASYNGDDYVIINVHYKCCDGSEDRRLQASIYLDSYIDNNYNNDKVIILGDFNDLLIDDPNVFTPFLNNPNDYEFTDIDIAQIDMIASWSFPGWPSHLDHIIITNELFGFNQTTETLLIDNIFFNSLSNYDNHISDHRPVGIKLPY